MKNTTRQHILKIAVELAAKVGYTKVTREAIAAKADVVPSHVSYHLGTMLDLRRHIMREAIRVECLPVIAQGLAVRDKHALKVSEELRQAAVAQLGV